MLELLFHPERLPFVVDWAAWATLAAGLAAVVGAYRIGIRQASIAERQTALLQQQANLERIKLRAELYSRRMVVYQAARNYVDQAAINEKADRQVQQAFFEALGTSRFLLGPEIAAWMQQAYACSIHVSVLKARTASQTAPYDDAKMDQLERLYDELNQLRATLDDKFRPYVGLIDPHGDDTTAT